MNQDNLTLKAEFNIDLFFDLSPDFLCIVSFDGVFKKVNQGVCNILGYTQEELLNTKVENYMHPLDRSRTLELREQIKKGKSILHYENRYVCKNGDVVWLAWTSMPSTPHQLIYGSAKNITHKKKLEAERIALLDNLTSVNEELMQLTYTTSHDLRSPVNNMLTVLSLIDRSTITDPELLDYLEILQATSEGLKKSLNDNMDIINNKTKLNSQIEKISLSQTLESVAKSIQSLLDHSDTHFNLDFSEFDRIKFNRSYLESIFLNLITNSIKYSKIDIAPIISIKTFKNNGKLHLTFSDNGIGLNMEKVKDKIFGLNQVFHDHTDSKGIGLYLVKSHLNSLGGEIYVSSEEGVGTTFTIIFNENL